MPAAPAPTSPPSEPAAGSGDLGHLFADDPTPVPDAAAGPNLGDVFDDGFGDGFGGGAPPALGDVFTDGPDLQDVFAEPGPLAPNDPPVAAAPHPSAGGLDDLFGPEPPEVASAAVAVTEAAPAPAAPVDATAPPVPQAAAGYAGADEAMVKAADKAVDEATAFSPAGGVPGPPPAAHPREAPTAPTNDPSPGTETARADIDDEGNINGQIWFPDGWTTALGELAQRADPENWGPGHATLAAYLRHTWRRLVEEGKVVTADGRRGRVAVFHTGLFTTSVEPVYAVLEENLNRGRQPWVLREWAAGRASGRMQAFAGTTIEAAYFFDRPEDVVFDRRLPVVASLDHIVGDNVDRFPPALRDNEHQRRLLTAAAVKDAEAAAGANWRLAVPHYYRAGGTGPGRVQLLLPLCLQTPGTADLALALDRGPGAYRAHTVLTLEMAARNARLLARPGHDWLNA